VDFLDSYIKKIKNFTTSMTELLSRHDLKSLFQEKLANKEWYLSKNALNGSSFFVNIILFVGIIVIVNLISSQYFIRFDLTRNKAYTLSKSTIKILHSIDDTVRIKGYFSSDIPPYLLSLRNDVRDMLYEYEAHGKGNLRVEFYDPDTSKESDEKAQHLGIPKVKMSAVQKDKREVRNVYMGLAILYENKREIIRMVQNSKNLEYRITSAIKKITAKKVPHVAFLMGNGCKSISKSLSILKEKMEENFVVAEEPLVEGESIPKMYDTFILAGPTIPFTPRQLFEIDQFLMAGKSLIVLADSIVINKNKLLAMPVNNYTLFKTLAKYGVRLNNNLIIDSRCATTRFSGGNSPPYPLDYAFWPKVENFNKKSPIVNLLEFAVFPWVREVTRSRGKLDKNSHFIPLASSSSRSWKVKEPYNLSPTQHFNAKPEDAKNYNIACLLTGKIKSFFSNKNIPAPNITNKERKTAFKNKDKIRPKYDEVKNGKLAVVGNSLFITNRFLKLFPANGVFFRNLVEYMTSGDDMISIRSRERPSPVIPELRGSQKNQIRWVNILCTPILVIVLGFMHFYFRNKEKEVYLESIRK